MLLTYFIFYIFLLSSSESGYTYYYDFFLLLEAVKYNWGHYYDLIIYYVIIETFNINFGISLTTAAQIHLFSLYKSVKFFMFMLLPFIVDFHQCIS